MKVYISIPISGQDEKKVREHADRIKAALSRAGHRPINPFDIYVGQAPTYVESLCSGLQTLADCDAIFLCEGWQFSRGCRIEANFAKEFGKQFMYESQPDSESHNFYFNR